MYRTFFLTRRQRVKNCYNPIMPTWVPQHKQQQLKKEKSKKETKKKNICRNWYFLFLLFYNFVKCHFKICWNIGRLGKFQIALELRKGPGADGWQQNVQRKSEKDIGCKTLWQIRNNNKNFRQNLRTSLKKLRRRINRSNE